MRKNAWLGVLVVCALLAATAAAVHIRRAERALELTERALRLLRPPLSEAVSVRDIRGREARELLEQAQALEATPERNSMLALARATELYAKDDYAGAERALADQPLESLGGTQLMAAIKLARGDARAAQELLERRPHADDDPRTALVRSDVARAMGRADLALSSIEPFFDQAQSPPSAALYERRGLAHEMLGDLAQARADLTRAAELDRRSISALLTLGRLQRQSGALAQAVLAFHEAAQRRPDDAEAWLGAGVCRVALGDTTGARVDLERAAAAAQTRAEPLIALADLDVVEHDLDSALRRYRAALLLDPQSALGHVKLGNTLLRLGEITGAIPEFQAAIAQRPDMAAAHNGLGAALFAQNDLDAAETELKSAADLDPEDPHPLLNLARLYKRRGDDRAQDFALERARERDPALVAAIRR